MSRVKIEKDVCEKKQSCFKIINTQILLSLAVTTTTQLTPINKVIITKSMGRKCFSFRSYEDKQAGAVQVKLPNTQLY